MNRNEPEIYVNQHKNLSHISCGQLALTNRRTNTTKALQQHQDYNG